MNWKAPIPRLSASPRIRSLYSSLCRLPLAGAALRHLARHIIPPGTRVWTCIAAGPAHGLWLHLDPRFEADYAQGNYEAIVERAICQHLKPGSVFYDVGSHIGVLSLLAARLVDRQGAVFAFEADPANAARVTEHAQRNACAQIHIVPCAVWSSTGRVRFARAAAQSSLNQGSVASEQGESAADSMEVASISLDDFACPDSFGARSHALPDLIKIDVEGAEAAVLRGSERVFAVKKPVLICEVHHEAASREVTRWLLERDYSFEWLMDSPRFPRHLLAWWRG